MQNNLSERSPVEIQHSLHHTGAAQRSSVYVFIIIGGSCHKYNVCRDKSFVATNKHVLVATNHVFCRDKSMLAATKLLSHHNYICHDKICLSRQIFSREHVFVATNILWSRQKTCFVATKHLFVPTKLCLSRQIFVATKVLSRQNIFVATKDVFCPDKHMSRQKWYLWQLPQWDFMAYNYITFALYVRCGFSVSVSSQCKGIQIPNTGKPRLYISPFKTVL